jgi:Tfp pilus assembly protein PilF
MRIRALLLLSLALGGCAVAPPAPESERFFADSLFGPPSERIDAKAVFAVNDAMRKYLVDEIGFMPGTKGRQKALAESLRRKGLKLEYDAATTRTAVQAFEGRTGNCLSLVIMTAALAREMDVGVRYQSVNVDATWNRIGGMYFSIGHVNLTLGSRPPALGSRIDDGDSLLVDFQPPRDQRGISWRIVEEKTILAMYMNNRAAESLAAGKADDAYWFAREAIRQDPQFNSSWNTLGIIYHRGGHLAEAARTFAHALDREPRNTHVMSNLVPVLAGLGRAAESQALERRLAQLEPEPAFTYFNRGLVAMREGDFAAARDLFAKEVDRAPYYHEFHFWLALALANLGDTERAKRHLSLAMESSTSRTDHEIYAAKLDRIRSARLH